MKIPEPFLRGATWCADLRAFGGNRRESLGVTAEAAPFEVGMALQRKLDELRLGAQVSQPLLPGIENPGMLVRELCDLYEEGRDYDTDGGALYVHRYISRIKEDLGHLSVRQLAAPDGETVLRTWRDKLWERELANKTVRNFLTQMFAILRWGRSGGRRLTGDLPEKPNAVRRGQTLAALVFDYWVEGDFRELRERFADEWVRMGRLPPDRAFDIIAKRKLYLSFAFYTGMHTEDLNKLSADWVSVAMGRYERHNTKSARAVKPEWFDMPEQLQLDCEAELSRIGRDWLPGELICGGRWKAPCDSLTRAAKRLGLASAMGQGWQNKLARRSMVREYTIRGWRTHEISALLGHVDERMVQEVYRKCTELGLVSSVRVPWSRVSGPNGAPTQSARTFRLTAV